MHMGEVDVILSLISALVGGLIGSVATYHLSVRLLVREARAQTYSILMTALQRLFSVRLPVSRDYLDKLEGDLNQAYAQLIIFVEDRHILEFHRILEVQDLNKKSDALKMFALDLRREIHKKTRLTPKDLKKIEIERPTCIDDSVLPKS